MNCVIREVMFNHGLLKRDSGTIGEKCLRECGVYIVVGDEAFSVDGGSAYRLAKYLCINGWYPVTISSSYAISKINYIIKNKIPVITVGGARANSFTEHVYNMIMYQGSKLPFPQDLPGCRSKHKN
jgi:hypothetical protein